MTPPPIHIEPLTDRWRPAAVHLDAVTRARTFKPAIPALGANGIPLRDELEFEWRSAAVRST